MLIALVIISLCSGAVSGINLWMLLSIKRQLECKPPQVEHKPLQVEPIVVCEPEEHKAQRSGRNLSPDSNKARVLSKDERRDLIAARAFEQQPVVRTNGLIPPDREAQTHLNDWQARIKKS
jgi:hypothetical protein